jgi:hypothetical protein
LHDEEDIDLIVELEEMMKLVKRKAVNDEKKIVLGKITLWTTVCEIERSHLLFS